MGGHRLRPARRCRRPRRRRGPRRPRTHLARRRIRRPRLRRRDLVTTTDSHDVLITTAFLEPGDEVDRMLRAAGLTTRHEPELAQLAPDDRADALSGARAIIAGTRPLGEEEFAL